MGTHYSPRIVTDGLILYLDAANTKSYPGTGTAWYDLSGNNNHSTLVDGPTFNPANLGSIDFDGTAKFITVADSSSINFGTGDFSLEFFIKLNNLSHYILNKAAFGGGRGYAVAVIYDNLWFGIQGDANYATLFNLATIAVTTGIILNITLVCNQTTNFAHAYINGVLKGSNDISTQVGTTTGTSTLYLSSQYSPSYYANNKRYVTKIYNKALSAAEVLQNYNALKSRYI